MVCGVCIVGCGASDVGCLAIVAINFGRRCGVARERFKLNYSAGLSTSTRHAESHTHYFRNWILGILYHGIWYLTHSRARNA